MSRGQTRVTKVQQIVHSDSECAKESPEAVVDGSHVRWSDEGYRTAAGLGGSSRSRSETGRVRLSPSLISSSTVARNGRRSSVGGRCARARRRALRPQRRREIVSFAGVPCLQFPPDTHQCEQFVAQFVEPVVRLPELATLDADTCPQRVVHGEAEEVVGRWRGGVRTLDRLSEEQLEAWAVGAELGGRRERESTWRQPGSRNTR